MHSDGHVTNPDVGGRPFAHTDGDARPQLTGIYSDVHAAVDDTQGLSFTDKVDDRYNSHPTPTPRVVA